MPRTRLQSPTCTQHGQAGIGHQGRFAPLRGGLRPSLTADPRLAPQKAGRDEGMVSPVEQRDRCRPVVRPQLDSRYPLGFQKRHKFHVVAHASAAVDQTRRIEQRTDPSLKGLRWKLLKDRDSLSDEGRADLDALIAQVATKRTPRAWLYRENLRDILERKQINVVSAMLKQWCTNVLRSKVEPMKDVARMIRRHFDGIVAWTQTRQTNGFIEALNGLFQAAKRKARGYTRFATMRTVLFLIAGKLDFTRINPQAA
jgi:transposase